MPAAVASDLGDCLTANAVGRLEPLEWQEGILDGWLGRRADGKWAATACGMSVPRQNGKTLGVVEVRMNYGLLVLGEEIVYTAHLQKTSTEIFEDMKAFFEQPRIRRHVADIKTALGREQIIMRNGGRVKFVARTRNGGRGLHGDLLVFDEAQELTAFQQGSFLPVISASPNPQTIYIGTPPDEGADGEVFWRIRKATLDGDNSATAWAEWSVPEIGDVTDRDRWWATNPSLGVLIDEETVATECEQMASDTFARERLGWWAPRGTEVEHPIRAEEWDACATADPPEDGLMAVAVKFAVDGSRGTLAVCLKPEGGKPYIEAVESRNLAGGTGWFARWLVQRRERVASCVIDGKAGSEALAAKLAGMGMPKAAYRIASTRDMAAANSMLVDAVREGEVEHFAQPALDAAATKCAKREIGSGGIGFADTDEGDSTLIEACALALREAMTTKRRPGRKAVVY